MTVPNRIYSLSLLSSTRWIGSYWTGSSLVEYQAEFMPDNLSLEAGLDQMVRAEITYSASHHRSNISPALDHFHLMPGIMPNMGDSYVLQEVEAEENISGILYFISFETGVSTWLNSRQDNLVADGLFITMVNYDPAAPNQAGENVFYTCHVPSLKIYFLNPIVNDISRLWSPTAGGVEVVLTGLGFNNPDSQLEVGGPDRTGGWSDRVDEIDFVGLQGQGTTTITVAAGDFTVDSNSQITIPANKFPALSAGTYHMNIKKKNVNLDNPTDITGYAGDWICDSDGKVYPSNRISFFIDDDYVARRSREKKAPLILTDWHLKDRSDGTEVMKYYAMDYLRCPDRVYKGNLSAISSIPRGFDSKTGLFKISDLTLDLANNDLEFSKLLAGTTILKNQTVKVYQAYPDEPFGWRSHIISLMIDDYYFEDDIFRVKMKDITQKYFRVGLPREICTEDEYSSIHPDSKTAFIPEVLGLCSLTTGEFRGQIEALCINTTLFKYVAANGPLYSIDQVYSDDIVAVDTSDYAISVEYDGRTYITFTGDQGDKKVTFNCKGYTYAGLNSDNGYIQNPAYIILYLLLELLKIPSVMIDFASFEKVADIYDSMGEAESGKLILQDEQDPMDVLQDLLAGSKCYIGKDGRITLGKKDISNYATNNSDSAAIIFRQLESIGKAIREHNLRDAINTINAEYDYCPTWDLFKSNISDQREVWIEPWDFIPVERKQEARTPRRRRGGQRRIRAWAR